MDWWRMLVEYFTPDSLRGDWEGMRRLQLMIGLALTGLLLGGSYGVFYWAIGHDWGVAVIVVCILLQICVPFLIRATGRVRLGGHLSLVVWGVGFSFLAALEGGLHGFAIGWLLCGGPLLALLLLDRFEALFWCAFFLISTLVFSGLEIARIALPLGYPERWQPAVLVSSILGLVVFMVLLGVLFEHSRKAAIASMERALAEREQTNRAKIATEESNRAKDVFMAVLNHELRTPLTPVLALTTDMETQENLPREMRQTMAMIRRNVELEAKLIDDLLDITRISSGKLILEFETVDAHACMQNVVEICRPDIDAREIQTSIQLKAEHHHVRADSVRLRQVFWNLLRNAIKFTPPKGRIFISSKSAENGLIVRVTDTGIGIEPDILPRIFNAFEQGETARTRRFGGLGLGLSIAKRLVDMHHGKLTASSKGKNKGAAFTVELATAPAPVEAPALAVAPKTGNGDVSKILLVEDDRDTLRILTRLLQRHGYQVTSADTFRKGLELSANGMFDILVSDLGLPDGSGLDLMRRIKALHGTPGIALSGYGTDDDFSRSHAAGFAEHIVKPVSFNTLRAAIQRIAGS